MKKRMLALLLGLCLCITLLPVPALAADTGTADDFSDLNLPENAEIIGYRILDSDPIDPNIHEAETVDSIDSNGKCALTAGNHELYVDRMDLSDWARELYNQLVEGSDNDGVNDFLINQKTDDGSVYIDAFTTQYYPEEQYSDYTSDYWYELGSSWAYLNAAYQAFDRDHPEVFWIKDLAVLTAKFTNETDGTFCVKAIIMMSQCFDSHYTTAKVKEDIEFRDQRVAEILAGAPDDPAYKVRYFNDWLVSHNEYNTLVSAGKTSSQVNNNSVWECISALYGRIDQEGPVCEAYARAMMVLCRAAEIPCVLVNDSEHMWNYIEIGDTWYAQDVTWNDPLTLEMVGATLGTPVSGIESNNFTLVGGDTLDGDETFLSTHPVTNQYGNGAKYTNGPELSSTAYDWSTHIHTAAAAVQENVTEITDTADGYYDSVIYCTGCGEEISRETVTLHNYTAAVTDPTCTAGGYTTYTCTNCGDSYTADETAALGHAYTAVVTDPTCTAKGYTTYTCSRCGDSYKADETASLGHNYLSEVITEPTTTETGLRGYVCTRCQNIYFETIDKLRLKTPTATVSAKALSTSRKVTITGTLADYENISDYYTVTAHGLLYITTSRLGSRELTFSTSGRTRVTFGAYKADGSFCYTMRTTSVSASYTARAFVTYTDADGNSVTVYSEPMQFSYNGLKAAG